MPKTQAERLWLVGATLIGFVVVVIGYFFFIGPQRSDTDDVDSQVSTTQLQNTILHSRISGLEAQNKDLARYQRELAQANLALPSTSGLPDFLRTLQSISGATLTSISSLTVGTPTALTSTAATPGAAPTTTPSPAPATGTTPAATGATGSPIYALPITAQVIGSPAQLSSFLGQLQSVQPRAVLVSSIVLGSADSGAGASGATTGKGQTTLQVSMQAFVQPPAVPAGLAPLGGTPVAGATTGG